MSVKESNSTCAPVATLRGVGPERTQQLARLGVHTIEDLLLLQPRRYEDRRQCRHVIDLKPGETALVHGRILAQGVKYWRRRTRSVYEFVLEDGTGRLHCRWWNQPYLEGHFRRGEEVLVHGKVNGNRPVSMDHPEAEVVEGGEEASIHLNRIVPIYPLTEGLPQRWLRTLIWRMLQTDVLPTPNAANLDDPRPSLPGQEPLPNRVEAIRSLHSPASLEQAGRARQRLAFDELLALQQELLRRRQRLEASVEGLPCAGDNRRIRPFLRQLGFPLTEAQTRVLREIREDLGRGRPMRRLLQGDVGSGKTVVSACAALMALESGYDVALMAPTEILANQHFANFQRWFEPLGLRVDLRTGNRTSRTEECPVTTRPEPASGGQVTAAPRLTVGTHALIEEGYVAERLGLVIIDEQHRFGVAQREALVRKGHYPHVLVMTATPIPRTLGLTLYGDLDLSVIDHAPPGRGRVRTFVRGNDSLPKVWNFVRTQLEAGRQAYVVYPRIEESTPEDLRAVKRAFHELQSILSPFSVGLLHGRLPADEKAAALRAFRERSLSVLVATSMIEVGLDVPNATVLVIEDADAFGLAQLHQLRGRIGRGSQESHCILVARLRTEEARRRLRVLEATNDGFRIAEEDLRLRGPGALLGSQQSGLPPFRFTDLSRDLALVELARDWARAHPGWTGVPP